MPAFEQIQDSLRPLRGQIVGHPLYARINSPQALRRFMEHHVFAVWDFMTLLKALQRELTCVNLPWRPAGDPTSRRLINAIVLAEESDEDGRGGFASHFEMYHEAMKRAEADTRPIDRLIALVARDMPVSYALKEAQVPAPAARFVETTWRIVAGGSLPAIAAAFTLGREELIPDLFRSVVSGLAKNADSRFLLLDHYLARHIELDEDEHSPMAFRMLGTICGENPARWEEARSAAEMALKARLELWDGIAEGLD